MGFEPTRAEHIGLAVQRLNHSATSSCTKCTAKSAFHPHTSGFLFKPFFRFVFYFYESAINVTVLFQIRSFELNLRGVQHLTISFNSINIKTKNKLLLN